MKSSRILLTLLLAAGSAFGAASFVIVNNDPPGVGFNDPSAVEPVGGNTGTTRGQQRINAFVAAANIWAANLNSAVPIRIQASWNALACTASSAVLASAGPLTVWREVPGVAFANTWYHVALANKIFGADLDTSTNDIQVQVNVNLGAANCFAGIPFYLGLDNNHGIAVDLVSTLLHEFGHGLGFSNVTNGSTGAQLEGRPSMWDRFLLDNTTAKTWFQMTNAERAASAINSRKLVWNGANTMAGVPQALNPGVPSLNVTGPAAGPATGSYSVGRASFGAALFSPGLTGQIMPLTGTGNQVLGCDPFNAANTLAVKNNFALIDRGVCAFVVKVKNAQDAGAAGVIIADNVAGSPPPDLGGADATITIPAVRVTLPDGNAIKARLLTRSRTASGVVGTIGIDLALRAGADALFRPMLFTPNPFVNGSSVSHWDTLAFPNQLMEPAINGDLTHTVTLPADLTFSLLKDLGWN